MNRLARAAHGMARDLRALPGRVRALLLTVLITGITTFMLMPFLTVSLTERGFGIGPAGLCVAAILAFQQAAGPASGWLADRYSLAPVMTVGLMLRAGALVLLAVSGSYALLLGACVVLGMGGSMISLPIRLELIRLPEEDRRQTMALRGAAVNLGALVGPGVGGVLISASFATVCFLSAAIQIGVIVLVWCYARGTAPYGSPRPGPGPAPARQLRGAGAASLLVVSFAFWAAYSQINTTMPVAIVEEGLTTSALSGIFILNAAIVLTLEYPLIRLLARKMPSTRLARWGLVLFGAAFCCLAVIPGIIGFVLFIILVSFAEIGYTSSIDDVIARSRPGGPTGAYVGLYSVADGAGSTLGAAGGAELYSKALDLGAVPWFWVAFAGLMGAGAVLVGRRTRSGVGKEL
jgi:MFS family permease